LKLLVDPALIERPQRLLERLQRVRDEWRPWKAWCLHIGTVAGLLAALVTVVLSVHEALAAQPH